MLLDVIHSLKACAEHQLMCFLSTFTDTWRSLALFFCHASFPSVTQCYFHLSEGRRVIKLPYGGREFPWKPCAVVICWRRTRRSTASGLIVKVHLPNCCCLRATLSICHIIVVVPCYSVEETIALHSLIYLYLRGKVATMIMSAQWALRMQNIEKDST